MTSAPSKAAEAVGGRAYQLHEKGDKKARWNRGDARHARSPAHRADAPGLSKVHNRTEPVNQHALPAPTLTWYPGASLVEVSLPREKQPDAKKRQKPRGKITEWSASSRARLKRFLGTLLSQEMGRALVVTLTYPAEFPAPDDHAIYKAHLHAFQMAMLRKWPQASGIWKLEFQQRGAAHYHMLLFGLFDILTEVREWVMATWYRVAHKGDIHQGKAGTQVDPIKSAGGAAAYLLKYLGKVDQTLPGNFSGRYWGKLNTPKLPIVEPETMELTAERAAQLQRIARCKVQKDVEASRWKRFLEKEREQYWTVGGRLFWETLKSANHGSRAFIEGDEGARKPFKWMMKIGGKIEIDDEVWETPLIYESMPFSLDLLRKDLRRLPHRWKPRNNSRVRVLCNASVFVEAMLRLDKPASSFLAFSRPKQDNEV